jgi:hypothetical protein
MATNIANKYSPGFVTSDMGYRAIKAFAESGVTVEQISAISPTESANAIMAVIDKAEKGSHGGKFWSYDGSELEY